MCTKISISTLIFWSLFPYVGINTFPPNNKPVKPMFCSFVFDFPLKEIVPIVQNIQKCFEDWIFNLLLIPSNDFSKENFLEMIKSAKNQHTKSITTAFYRSPTVVLYKNCSW